MLCRELIKSPLKASCGPSSIKPSLMCPPCAYLSKNRAKNPDVCKAALRYYTKHAQPETPANHTTVFYLFIRGKKASVGVTNPLKTTATNKETNKPTLFLAL